MIFKDVTPAEAFEFLARRTSIKVFYAPGKPDERRITLSLTNIPASELMRAATQLVGLTFTYEKDGIRVFSAATKVKLSELENQFKTAIEPALAQATQNALTSYMASVQRTFEAAARYGDSGVVVALQNESRRLKESPTVPAGDPAGLPPALIALRANYRSTTTTLARSPQLLPLYERYDASLASLAESLADEPGEIAAVNAVRARLATSRKGGVQLLPVSANIPKK